MIRCGDKIRLTEADKLRLAFLTETYPDNIKTVSELNQFIESYMGQLDHASPEDARILHLLQQEIIG